MHRTQASRGSWQTLGSGYKASQRRGANPLLGDQVALPPAGRVMVDLSSTPSLGAGPHGEWLVWDQAAAPAAGEDPAWAHKGQAGMGVQRLGVHTHTYTLGAQKSRIAPSPSWSRREPRCPAPTHLLKGLVPILCGDNIVDTVVHVVLQLPGVGGRGGEPESNPLQGNPAVWASPGPSHREPRCLGRSPIEGRDVARQQAALMGRELAVEEEALAHEKV